MPKTQTVVGMIHHAIEEVITDRQLFQDDQLVRKRIRSCILFRAHSDSDRKVALVFDDSTYAIFGYERDSNYRDKIDLNLEEIPHYLDLQRLGLLSKEEFVRIEAKVNRYYNSEDKKRRRELYEKLKTEFENEK